MPTPHARGTVALWTTHCRVSLWTAPCVGEIPTLFARAFVMANSGVVDAIVGVLFEKAFSKNLADLADRPI